MLEIGSPRGRPWKGNEIDPPAGVLGAPWGLFFGRVRAAIRDPDGRSKNAICAGVCVRVVPERGRRGGHWGGK